MVTLYTEYGGTITPFNVHQNLLCDVSMTFRDIFRSSFRNVLESSFVLNSVHKDTFNQFMQWLYRGNIKFWANKFQEQYLALARLSSFAERYRVAALNEVVVDTMIECSHINIWLSMESKSDYSPNSEIIEYVYTYLDAKSPFRQILVAWYVYHRYKYSTSQATQDLLLRIPEYGAEIAVANERKKTSSKAPCYIHQRDELLGKPIDRRYPMQHLERRFPKSVLNEWSNLSMQDQYEIFYLSCKRTIATPDKVAGMVENAVTSVYGRVATALQSPLSLGFYRK